MWGEGALSSLTGSARLSADMLEVYETDYIAAWEAILNDLDVVPFSGPRTSEALAILAASTSPLRGFLKAVDDNTFLAKPEDPAQAGTGIRSRLDQVFARGKEAMGLSTGTPGARVTSHFAPIHRVVAGGPGGAPIDGVLATLGQLQQRLAPIGTAAARSWARAHGGVGAVASGGRSEGGHEPAGGGNVPGVRPTGAGGGAECADRHRRAHPHGRGGSAPATWSRRCSAPETSCGTPKSRGCGVYRWRASSRNGWKSSASTSSSAIGATP